MKRFSKSNAQVKSATREWICTKLNIDNADSAFWQVIFESLHEIPKILRKIISVLDLDWQAVPR